MDPPASEIDRNELDKVKQQQTLVQKALDELIVTSPTVAEVTEFKEKLKLIQQAIDELIIATIQ
ncbi:hypothetical protein [Bacillus cereus group sp. RP32]|uniref:hypothetical protein n=1 Tax=Bacillus cereus group sp. RP32 TaxID=3040258 RepID=UPI00339AF288